MVNIEKFREWLDEEIDRIGHYRGNNNMLSGCYSEAIRIRQMLCNMDAEKNPELEEVAGEICDHYCKFPEAYGDREDDNQRMIEEKCNKCPLDRLIK